MRERERESEREVQREREREKERGGFSKILGVEHHVPTCMWVCFMLGGERGLMILRNPYLDRFQIRFSSCTIIFLELKGRGDVEVEDMARSREIGRD